MQVDSKSPIEFAGGKVTDDKGRVLALFDGAWEWKAGRASAKLKAGTVATLAIPTKPFEAEELRARVTVGVRMITLQQQLADRILALEESLAHVQQLQGLIPICAWCRQVRSDGNFWEKVESYLGKRSGLQFTHAICPTCKAKQTEGLKQLRPA